MYKQTEYKNVHKDETIGVGANGSITVKNVLVKNPMKEAAKESSPWCLDRIRKCNSDVNEPMEIKNAIDRDTINSFVKTCKSPEW